MLRQWFKDVFSTVLGHNWRLGRLATFVATAYVVQKHIMSVNMGVGPSMEPTIDRSGSIILTKKYDVPQVLKAGDIVLCQSPLHAEKYKLLKRLIATEGDVIQVLIDGKIKTQVVPRGHAWVEGDNPVMSEDSRYFGPIPIALIEGIAIVQLYPKFGICERTLRFHENFVYKSTNVTGVDILNKEQQS